MCPPLSQSLWPGECEAHPWGPEQRGPWTPWFLVGRSSYPRMTVGMTNLRRITGSWSFGRQKADVKELDWFSRKDLCLTAERDFGPVVPAPLLHHLFAYRDLNKLSLKQEIPLGKKYNQSKSGTGGTTVCTAHVFQLSESPQTKWRQRSRKYQCVLCGGQWPALLQ